MHVHICIRVCTLSPGQMEQQSALKLRCNSFISTGPYSTSQHVLEPPQQTGNTFFQLQIISNYVRWYNVRWNCSAVAYLMGLKCHCAISCIMEKQKHILWSILPTRRTGFIQIWFTASVSDLQVLFSHFDKQLFNCSFAGLSPSPSCFSFLLTRNTNLGSWVM